MKFLRYNFGGIVTNVQVDTSGDFNRIKIYNPVISPTSSPNDYTFYLSSVPNAYQTSDPAYVFHQGDTVDLPLIPDETLYISSGGSTAYIILYKENAPSSSGFSGTIELNPTT